MNLVNRDNNYSIEYKEKYIYGNKYLYSDTKYIKLENTNIPLKYRLIDDIYVKVSIMNDYQDKILKKDINETIEKLILLKEEVV